MTQLPVRNAADVRDATLSLDLDDTWAYLRTRGEPDWAAAPSILPLVADRLLPVLDGLGVRATVFVVGFDAERAEGAAVVERFAAAGHEIASHSFLHRGELSGLGGDEIAEDVSRAADAIQAATGVRPAGFRCPSFGTSRQLLAVLAGAGYTYDASVLPTTLGPLLRAYYRLRMRVGRRGGSGAGSGGGSGATAGATDAAPGTAQLFGPNANALLPLAPFRWTTPAGPLLELPVSSLPVLRTPIHMSYLQALAARSPGLADRYLRTALAALDLVGVPPSFLLHPTDVIDTDDAPRLGFFPGLRRPWPRKLAQVRRAFEALADGRRIVPLGDLAASLEASVLPERSPGRPAAVAVSPR